MKKMIFTALFVFIAVNANAAVLATANGKNITDEDVAFLLRTTPGAKYDTLPDEAKQQLLDQAIDRRLMMDYAIQSGIEKDSEYKTALNSIKEEIALEIWMKKEFDKIKVSEDKIKEFYNNNSARFMMPERVKASHILVESEAEANKIIKELSGLKGEKLDDKFADLARKNSKDPAGQNGGELGWFAKNQMLKPFSDTAFALKKGEVTSKPVQTQFGYHVIYVEDKQASKQIDYSEVRDNIEGMIKADEFKVVVSNKAKEIRNKAKIEIKK